MEREFDWFSRQDNARPQASPDLQPSPTKGTLADFLPSITKGEDGSELSRADGAATTSSGGGGSGSHQELETVIKQHSKIIMVLYSVFGHNFTPMRNQETILGRNLPIVIPDLPRPTRNLN